MKKNILSLALALVVSTFTSCATTQKEIVASKNYETKQVKVGNFDGISTSTSIDVIYTQTSGRQNVEVYAPDNVIQYVRVEVEDGILKVGFNSKGFKNGLSIRGEHKTQVRVSAPEIRRLYASSSGDIILKNGLQTTGLVTMKSSSSGDIKGGDVTCDELVAMASSSGDVELGKVECVSLEAKASSSGDVEIAYLTAESVNAQASSSGDVILSGKADKANFEASSSGNVEAKHLKVNQVAAKASSSGDVFCHAVESLDATTSSSGSVNYKGNPSSINYHPKKGLNKIE